MKRITRKEKVVAKKKLVKKISFNFLVELNLGSD